MDILFLHSIEHTCTMFKRKEVNRFRIMLTERSKLDVFNYTI